MLTGMVGLVLLLALGSALLLALVHLAVSLWRSVRRAVLALPGSLKSLTVEPPPGSAFNDSRDVWPMPKDD
ncbi:hypothetical protein [Micromonospora avicenniae]|uniref:hypothetical protein n=1 Tax=Micromonospora avicenniae TaxID=1198245 RepID=UPI00333096A6